MLSYSIYLSLLYSGLVFLVYSWARRSLNPQIQVRTALDLGSLLMIFGFIGARLFHVFYENPNYYNEDWWRVFAVWQGGFVFYGGAVLAFTAGFIFIKIKNLNWLIWADFYAPVVALGYGLGRFSCYLAGCCYGSICQLPWAIDGRHPTQLYAMTWELLSFINLLRLKHHTPKLASGGLFYTWLGFHALGRLMMEYFRDDFRGWFFAGLSISSWISCSLLLIAGIGWWRVSKFSTPH